MRICRVDGVAVLSKGTGKGLSRLVVGVPFLCLKSGRCKNSSSRSGSESDRIVGDVPGCGKGLVSEGVNPCRSLNSASSQGWSIAMPGVLLIRVAYFENCGFERAVRKTGPLVSVGA